MKTALFIEDWIKQIVLTPESDHEKKILNLFHEKWYEYHINNGNFYECRWWYIRWSLWYQNNINWWYDRSDSDSTFIVFRKKDDLITNK